MLGVYKQLSLSVISAKGCELITNDNRKILDLYGGHAVMPLGYGEVNFLDSVNTQMTKLLFQSNLLPLEIRARAAENLLAIAPDGLAKVFFVNSGSEANDTNRCKLLLGEKKYLLLLMDSMGEQQHQQRLPGAQKTIGMVSQPCLLKSNLYHVMI